MSVLLRAARSTDAGAVGGILSGFIDETDWMPRIHTRAEDLSFAGMLIDRGWVQIVEDDHGVVGFCAREEASIHALYVAGHARRGGYGRRLLQAAQAETGRLELWTFQANNAAQGFYEAHGFKAVEHTDGSGNDEKLPDIRYVWQRELTA